MTTSAPNDLIARLDAAIESKWVHWGLHFNRDDYLDFMRSELAARDAEIAKLHAALRKCRAHTSYGLGADFKLLAGLLASVERIVDAALAAERTQGDTP